MLNLRPLRIRFALTRLKSTFAYQHKLPKLPVPSIQNLQEKYLKSCEPILSESEYETTSQVVQKFFSPQGLGPTLQKRLVSRAGKTDNWLEEFWLQKAYLEYRDPSLINVNWWCQFIDHPEQSQQLLTKLPPKGVLTAFQLKRAAGLISNLLNFNDLLNSEKLPPELIKDKPICMNQYTRIFQTTRVPGEKSDLIQSQYPTTSKHIIVMVKDQFFKVDVYTDDNRRVSIAALERVLYDVGKQVLATPPEANIGLLTAGKRDTWYEAYELLKQLSPTNTENLKLIQSALFVVCLDDYSAPKNIDLSHHQMFHNHNARNRFFDKSIQLIVASNGRAGLNGEHTPSDAVVPGNVMNYILKNEPAIDPEESVSSAPLPKPVKLTWTIDAEITKLIQEAQATAKKLIDDTESCLLQTDVYGSRFIKEVAKTSPDAYVQLALQLTYWRLYKEVTPVYESASLRAFKNGRTETGRSTSNESVAFVKSFDDDEVLYDTKRELFRKAIDTQTQYMRDASTGSGIDRHMLGLYCVMDPVEAEKGTIFIDPAYKKTTNFKLSTSNMSPGTHFYGGFGPVVDDGYGINYAIGKDDLKFSISSKKSSPKTNSFKFRQMLERTLIDMFILFPKRSEVWGKDWKVKHAQEKREEYRLLKMKELSDQLKSKQAILAERYKSE